jgi:beta-glucosidase
MAFRYTPEGVGDTVPFAVAGVSDWEIEADGRQVASGQLRTRPGDDPATAILTPPWGTAELPVSGGSADVRVRFHPKPSEISGALALRVGRPPLDADSEELLREAATAASNADVAIVVVSTSADVESEGFDRTSLALPGTQDDLVRAVVAANPRTIVVVNSGAPVVLPWADDAAAVLAVWFPGQEFGAALAAVLSGDAEPAGRLPVTWPRQEADVPVTDVTPIDGVLPYSEGLHIGYRAWLRAGSDPAYPFGWGLGYTTWATEALEVSTDADGFTANVQLVNSGSRAGRTVVQLYASRPDSSLDRPATWLVGFAAVSAASSETITQSIRVPWRRLAYWHEGWQLEGGRFELRAGLHVDDSGVEQHVDAPSTLA